MFLRFIHLQINVIDQLTDPTMDRATSIVGQAAYISAILLIAKPIFFL